MDLTSLDRLQQTVDAIEHLASDLAVAKAEEHRSELAGQCDGRLQGSRVLVLGGARNNAPAFAGAAQVIECDRAWQEIEGSFEIVCCDGLLYRVPEPMALLRKVRALLPEGGLLLISSLVVADPERSEYLRFAPTGHAGDPDVRFIPGRLAFRWMVEAVGFEVEHEFGEREGPREGFPAVFTFLRARACENAEPRADPPNRRYHPERSDGQAAT